MGAAASANAAGDSASWHAMSADQVMKRLATNGENGLDAVEASRGSRNMGRTGCRRARSAARSCGSSSQFNNILVYVLLGAGFTKLMLSLWVDAAIIFAVVVLNGLLGLHPGRQGRESARFDPKHAVRRGADRARR